MVGAALLRCGRRMRRVLGGLCHTEAIPTRLPASFGAVGYALEGVDASGAMPMKPLVVLWPVTGGA